MTFVEYWESLKLQNSQLSDDSTKMNISTKAFREQLSKAHYQGWMQGRESRQSDPNPSSDFLNKLMK